MRVSERRLKSSRAIQEAFEWKVKDDSAAYSKLSSKALRLRRGSPIPNAYIDRSRNAFVSEAMDNYRFFGDGAAPNRNEKGVLANSKDLKNSESSVDSAKATPIALKARDRDSVYRATLTKCEAKETAFKAKTSAKLRQKSQTVTRTLPNSAVAKLFQKPIFALSTSKPRGNEILPKKSKNKTDSKLLKKANISENKSAKHSKTQFEEKAKSVAKPRRLSDRPTISRKASNAPSLAKLRGKSDLFGSKAEYKSGELNLFVCDSAFPASNVVSKNKSNRRFLPAFKY